MRPSRFFLRTFKGNVEDDLRRAAEYCRSCPLPGPLHPFKTPDQSIEIFVEVLKQLYGPRSDHGTIGRCADVAQLFQHVQRIADAVRGEVERARRVS